MKTLLLVGLIVAAVSIALKNWQCEELFPTANRLACILWVK